MDKVMKICIGLLVVCLLLAVSKNADAKVSEECLVKEDEIETMLLRARMSVYGEILEECETANVLVFGRPRDNSKGVDLVRVKCVVIQNI